MPCNPHPCNTPAPTQSRPRRSVAYHCHSELALDLADFQADVELGSLDRLAALLHLATTPPKPPAGLLVRHPTYWGGEQSSDPQASDHRSQGPAISDP